MGEVAGMEYRMERELAEQCGTWQQLAIMKKKMGEERENPSSCEGLTRSERLLWYRRNKEAVDLDNYRVSCSSNYRQLQLARGFRAVEETAEEKNDRARTRSEALLWYRNGGEQIMDDERNMANLCGTWKQFHLMTRGRSERLCWYRSGGKAVVDARDQLARDSSNWVQYKFRSKQELSDYFSEQRTEAMEEREAIRVMVRNKISKESVGKAMYEIHKQPWELEELEEESNRKVQAQLSSEERIEELRKTTESMLMHRTEYLQSARELAMQAIREDEQAVAASRQKRKVTVVEQAQSASVAA